MARVRDTIQALRFRLIEWLAGNDPVMVNIRMKGGEVYLDARKPGLVCRSEFDGSCFGLPDSDYGWSSSGPLPEWSAAFLNFLEAQQ